ncbi:MAG: DNA repair protein RecO [Gemmatimonadota bacterium]
MSIVRTEAFVLKAIRFGETSMIYRLFTRDRGVVPVMARGVRRPKSRFGAALGTFQRLLVTYYFREGREVQTLSGVDLLEAHRGIAASLARMDAAGRWFRFLQAVLPDGAPLEPLYALTVEGLERLERVAAGGERRWETFHRLAAAATLGLAPHLEACVGCGRELPDGGELAFSISEGGLVCDRCPSRPGLQRLSPRDFSFLTLYAHPDYGLIDEMEAVEQEEVVVQRLIHDFIRWHADLRPEAA